MDRKCRPEVGISSLNKGKIREAFCFLFGLLRRSSDDEDLVSGVYDLINEDLFPMDEAGFVVINDMTAAAVDSILDRLCDTVKDAMGVPAKRWKAITADGTSLHDKGRYHPLQTDCSLFGKSVRGARIYNKVAFGMLDTASVVDSTEIWFTSDYKFFRVRCVSTQYDGVAMEYRFIEKDIKEPGDLDGCDVAQGVMDFLTNTDEAA